MGISTSSGGDTPSESGTMGGAGSVDDTLGADPEQLDRITRLARRMFGVAASTITLLDGDRAWFPSSSGYSGAPLPKVQTPCNTTQLLGRPLEVADAREDERLADLDLVRSGAVVFYAGQPLRDHLGNIIGTLCLLDPEPRVLDDGERADLADLAAWAQHELVAATEMGQARQVQTSLFPEGPQRAPGWEVDGFCLSAHAVGGDVYDYGMGGGVLHLGVGDVMGKGTSAALLGAGARSAVRATHAAVTAGADLGVIATQVARSLLPDLERAGAFLTLFEAAIDLDDGYCRWVDAGAGLAAVVRADGSVEPLIGEDRPFGVFGDDHWSEHTVEIGAGDRLVALSDGVLDLVDHDSDPWPELVGAVRAAARPADLLDHVRGLAHRRTPGDDVTVLAVFRDASDA